MNKLFEKITKFSIYSLVFLTPLFLLPFTFEIYEFSKQYLIFFLVSIGFVAWFAKMIFVDKEIRFRKSPLNLSIFLFLLASIISAFFSVDGNSSLFGFYGRSSNGLVGLLAFGLFYLLIVNNTEHKEQQTAVLGTGNQAGGSLINTQSLTNLFVWSVFFVVMVAYLSVFGVWQKLPLVLPSFATQKTFNPASGSLEGLSVFLSIVLILLTGKLVTGQKKGRKMLSVLLVAIVVLMAIIDFDSSWIVLLISSILFLAFALITRTFREDINKLILPMILIFVSIIFLFVGNFTQVIGMSLAKEQVLGAGTSWKTALTTITSSLKNAFFGSGIGTWHYDFSKFKPLEFNNNILWQIRFDRAGNYIAELLATSGLMGFLSYSLMIIMFFLVFWVLRERKNLFPYIMAFTAIVISNFVYYQNTILGFTFWLILGLSVASWQQTEKSFKIISFKDFPELSLIFSTVLILALLLVSVSYYFAVRFYMADVNYAKAQATFNPDDRIALMEKAVSLNPKLSTYQTVLSRVCLSYFLNAVNQPSEQQDAEKIQELMAKAIEYGKSATDLSPDLVMVWETLGIVYRDIQPFVQGATDWATASFERAAELEGNNPVIYTELGKLYSITEKPEQAKQSFAKAKDLKPNYTDALLQEILTYEKDGDLQKAVTEMEKLAKSYPLYMDVQFHLGRLYFNNGELDKAIGQFEAIVQLVPNHSNALYSLGVVYSAKGEKQKAIEAFEKVLELNPNNQDIADKLKELKGEE